MRFHSVKEADPEARLSGFSQGPHYSPCSVHCLFFAVHIGFMWMLLLLAYGQRDPNAYFLQKHIRESFSRNISDTMSLGDVFSWADKVLLRNLFGEYSGEWCILCQFL